MIDTERDDMHPKRLTDSDAWNTWAVFSADAWNGRESFISDILMDRSKTALRFLDTEHEEFTA